MRELNMIQCKAVSGGAEVYQKTTQTGPNVFTVVSKNIIKTIICKAPVVLEYGASFGLTKAGIPVEVSLNGKVTYPPDCYTETMHLDSGIQVNCKSNGDCTTVNSKGEVIKQTSMETANEGNVARAEALNESLDDLVGGMTAADGWTL